MAQMNQSCDDTTTAHAVGSEGKTRVAQASVIGGYSYIHVDSICNVFYLSYVHFVIVLEMVSVSVLFSIGLKITPVYGKGYCPPPRFNDLQGKNGIKLGHIHAYPRKKCMQYTLLQLLVLT